VDTVEHDVLGIGFGPSNIALAIAMHEIEPDLRPLFVERHERPVWQGAQMLRGADIQNRDLVTPRNPRSHFSFVNFLHSEGRLLEHLNLAWEFPLRREYAQYFGWAAAHFDDVVRCGQAVTSLEIADTEAGERYVARCGDVEYRARAVVLASGRTPYLPDGVQERERPPVFHASRYLSRVTDVAGRSPTVAVLGASQSAIEIVLDLLRRFDGVSVLNVVPGLGYALKDTSPHTEESFLPWFTDYYFDASPPDKRRLAGMLRRSNYSVADADVIAELSRTCYEDRLEGRERVRIMRCSSARVAEGPSGLATLLVEDRFTGDRERLLADAVIVATGYRDLGPGERDERFPPLLANVVDRFETDADGVLSVGRDYALVAREDGRGAPGPLFLNGLCEHSHGLGDAGSLSLLALRSGTIVRGLQARLAPAPGVEVLA
jgi:L-ornithine N5-oxygenase